MKLDTINLDLKPAGNFSTTETPKRDWEKECRITLSTKVPEIRPTVLVDGSWLCTEGEIMLVSGQKKAGKSNAILYILATALMPDVDISKTLMIRSTFTKKKVVYLDTEQSLARTKMFIERVVRISGVPENPKQLMFYNIRHLSLSDRIDFFQNHILPQNEEIGLLVIDGIADMVDSINNEEKSKQLVDMIMSQLGTGMSIVTAIHEGKDGNGAMGHIGQLLEKKCAGTIALFKDRKKSIHTIKCKMVREGGDFDDIFFAWDTSVSGFRLLNDIDVAAISPKSEEQKNEELAGICHQIFAVNSYLDKAAVITGFLNYDNTINKSVKIESQKKAAQRRFGQALEAEIVELSDKGYSLKTESK